MIRPIEVSELGRLEAVALEFYGSSEFLEDFNIGRFSEVWRPLLESGAGVIFIEERGGEICGTIGGTASRDYGDKIAAQEAFWFVRETSRGGGIGLYRAFEAWAREVGASDMRMAHLVDSMPEKVETFYLRDGFRLFEKRFTKALA